MRAIVQSGYGGLEVLQAGTSERPRPRAGEVLVRVHAAGLDRGTWRCSLDQVVDAMRDLEAGRVRGKVAVAVDAALRSASTGADGRGTGESRAAG